MTDGKVGVGAWGGGAKVRTPVNAYGKAEKPRLPRHSDTAVRPENKKSEATAASLLLLTKSCLREMGTYCT